MKSNRYITQSIILVSVFLLAVTSLLGTILLNQSGGALRTQICARMLDVSESAAALLDGDSLARLSAEDKETEAYQKALDTLRIFQDHVELAYIYGIRDMGDGTFTFTIDPTVSDPGAFGEPVTTTGALIAASHGVSSVDQTPYTDRWGRFYSAYSPVYDSSGRVAGIVGVDFDAAWYEKQLGQQKITILLVGAASLLIGALIILAVTSRLQKRLVELNLGIGSLTGDMEELSRELRFASGQRQTVRERERTLPRSPSAGNSIETLNGMVREVHEEMRKYIADAHALAYTDALTGIGNRAALANTVDRLNRQIAEGAASFSVAVFDINGLKSINDEMGHERGDRLIAQASAALRSVFSADNVYRIGGDEFVAILEHTPPDAAEPLLAELDRRLAGSVQADGSVPSVSKGLAAYRAGGDGAFNDVFRRADEAMYADKARYYAEHGDRRRR